MSVVAALLFLNISINSSNGKVEEMYLSSMPEQAVAEGQCWLSYACGICTCPDQRDIACAAICHGSGVTCSEVVVVEQEQQP